MTIDEEAFTKALEVWERKAMEGIQRGYILKAEEEGRIIIEAYEAAKKPDTYVHTQQGDPLFDGAEEFRLRQDFESPATAHELSLERIQHDYTKAKLKATEEAYEALQKVPDTALVQKLVDALNYIDERTSHQIAKSEGFFTRWIDNPVKGKIKESLTEATSYLERIKHEN